MNDADRQTKDRIPPGYYGKDDLFRQIFDSVQTGLFLIDPKTHCILDINPEAAALIGDKRENIVGSVCHRFICPAEQGRCPITDLNQNVDRSERILLTRSGEAIPVIKSVGYIEIGGERYLLENVTDNSEYRKNEAAIHESERKIRAIFDQTFQFIGIMTPEGILTEANRSAVKFSGMDEKDVLGKFFWDTPWWTHSKELQDRLRDAVRRAAHGEFIRFEATHKAPDGTLHYIDFSLKPVMDENNKVIYLIPEGRDITDRKKVEDELNRKNEELYAAYEQLTATEEELRQNYDELAKDESRIRESERKIRAIFDQTFQFIGIMTPEGILTEANRSAVKFSGMDEKDVLGKFFWDTPWWTHSKELQDRLRDAVRRAAHGEFIRFEATHKAPDGTLHYIDFSLKPVMDENNKVIYLIPEGRDITDRKKVEDELNRKNEELYAAYEQLTATEEELRQNYDKLAKEEEKLTTSLKEKEVLLREIHHRVKNNLQIIISLLNLQCRSIPDKDVLKTIQECQNRVRAMALVHEKLYQSEYIADLDIKDYFRYLTQYLFQFYQVDVKSVSYILEGEPVRVGINTAIPLSLMINELVSNSLKHAFPEGKSGSIRITTEMKAGNIMITVGDNGVGMPGHVDPGTTGSLGLMLVKSLGNQIRADITLDRNQGTVFTIVIPPESSR